MPKYVISAPNGKTYGVTVPEGQTQADAISALRTALGDTPRDYNAEMQNLLASVPVQRTTGQAIKAGTSRAISRLGSLATDLIPAFGASVVGADDYAKRQLQEAAEKEAQLQEVNPSQFGGLEDVTPSTFLPFLGEKFGETLPDIAAMLTGSGIVGLGAKRLAASQLGKLATKEAAAIEAAKRIALPIKAPMTAAEKAAIAAPTIARGQVAGTLATGVGLSVPRLFENIYQQTGEMAPAAAAVGGALQGALDSVLPLQLGKIFKSSPPAFRAEVIKKLGERKQLPSFIADYAGKSATGALKGFGTEGLTEAAQEAIGVAAEKFVQDGEQFWDSEDFNRVFEAGVIGGAVGSPFGALGGAGKAARVRGIQQEELDRQAAAKIQAEEEAQRSLQEKQKLQQEEEQARVTAAREIEVANIDSEIEALTAQAEENPDDLIVRKKIADLNKQRATLTSTPSKATPKFGEAPDTIGGFLSGFGMDEEGFKSAVKNLNKGRGKTKRIFVDPKNPLSGENAEAIRDVLGGWAAANLDKLSETQVSDIQNALTSDPVISSSAIEGFKANAGNAAYRELVENPSKANTFIPWYNKNILMGRKLSDPDVANDVYTRLSNIAADAEESGNIKLGKKVDQLIQGSRVLKNLRSTQEPVTAPKPVPKTKTLTPAPETEALTPAPETEALTPAPETETLTPAPGTEALTPAPETETSAGATPVDRVSTAVRNFLGADVDPTKVEILEEPNNPNLPKSTGGVYDPKTKKVTLFAKNIRKGNELGVFLHEAGVHKGFQELLNPVQYAWAVNKIKEWTKEAVSVPDNKYKIQHKIALAATRRAGARKARRPDDELIAYFVEEAVKNYGVVPSKEIAGGTPLGQFFRRLREAFKKLLSAFGVDREPTPQDYVDLAAAIARAGTMGTLNLQTKPAQFENLGDEDAQAATLESINRNKNFYKGVAETLGNKMAARYAAADKLEPAFSDTENTFSDLPYYNENALNEYYDSLSETDKRVVDREISRYKRVEKRDVVKRKKEAEAKAEKAEYESKNTTKTLSNVARDIEAEAEAEGSSSRLDVVGQVAERVQRARVLKAFNYDELDFSIAELVDDPVGRKYASTSMEAYNNLASKVDNLIKKAPKFSQGALGKVRDLIETNVDVARLVTYTSTIPELASIARKVLKSEKLGDALDDLANVIHKRDYSTGMRREKAQEFLVKGRDILKKKSVNVVREFETLVSESTREQVQFDGPVPKDEKKLALYNRFQRFKAAHPDAAKLYFDLRDEYAKLRNEFKELILNEAKEVLSSEEKVRLSLFKNEIVPYFPLFRKGDYWVRFTEKDGTKGVSAFETPAEQREFAEFVRKNGGAVDKIYVRPTLLEYGSMMPTQAVEAVIASLKKSGATDSDLEPVYKIYLDMFPNTSIMQNFARRREGIKGERQDALTNFAEVGVRMGYNIDQSRAIREINESFRNIKSAIESTTKGAEEDVLAGAIDRAISAREKVLKHPHQIRGKTDLVASSAGHYAYTYYILGNISSAVVNLTQLGIVAFPMLGAKYGVGATKQAMQRASRMYFSGGRDTNSPVSLLRDKTFGGDKSRLSADHKALYEAATMRGAIRRSTGQDLREMREQGVLDPDKAGYKLSKVSQALGWVFQNSERYNREVTLLAAFDLARAKGVPRDAAIKQAIDFVREVHGESNASLSGEMFQSNIGKIIGVFKRFAWSQIRLQLSLLVDAIKGENSEVKKLARKQFLGINGAAFMFAGVKGMPVYGAANALSSVASYLFGDEEDEDFDLGNWILANTNNTVLNGVVGSVLDVSLAGRAGYADLLWRPDEKRLEDIGPVAYTLEQMLGAPFGIFRNIEKAGEEFYAGNYVRAIESALPSAAKNAVRTYRTATEGYKNRDGRPIIDEEPGLWNIVTSLSGFSDPDLAEAYTKIGIAKGATRKSNEERARILDAWYAADQAGDEEGKSEIQEDIDVFNSTKLGKDNPITPKTLRRSEKQRDAINEVSMYGARFPAKSLATLKEMVGD